MIEYKGQYGTAKVMVDKIDSATAQQINDFISHEAFASDQIRIMPDCHAGAGTTIGFTMPMIDKVIPNVIGVDIGCFVGKTKIPLLNGLQYTLSELEGKEGFYVYSIDKNLQIVPGKARCIKTRENAELIEVVISGGESIKCTPDHKFMLIDGSYKEAKDLEPKRDSLMCNKECKNFGALRRHEKSHKTSPNNHKVLFIRKLNYKEDVYCLQVEEHHNFALSPGVFVHNCGMLSMDVSNPSFNNMSMKTMDERIREKIPVGTSVRKKELVRLERNRQFFDKIGSALINFEMKYNRKFKTNFRRYDDYLADRIQIICKEIGMDVDRMKKSLGSLGGGNHFIEVGKSEYNGHYWVTIHTGSRQFGLKIAKYHQKKAGKGQLAYLEGQDAFDYLQDMVIAQCYADENRKQIADAICRVLGIDMNMIPCISSVHNYINFDDFIIRKGAISSYMGCKMIIPFNMEDGLLICMGKSNEEWNFSAPHGAGRLGSRRWAKETLSKDEAESSMRNKGIYFSKLPLDECKSAYKDPKIIEESIEPTAEIIDRIKPVLSIKGD